GDRVAVAAGRQHGDRLLVDGDGARREGPAGDRGVHVGVVRRAGARGVHVEDRRVRAGARRERDGAGGGGRRGGGAQHRHRTDRRGGRNRGRRVAGEPVAEQGDSPVSIHGARGERPDGPHYGAVTLVVLPQSGATLKPYLVMVDRSVQISDCVPTKVVLQGA